jgi:hypothetical protein
MIAMNKQEAVKLLALIKVAYPTAYRDMDEQSKKATVNMWAMSFPDVPYAIMEQALNHFRMTSKFPPTVAEMVEELKHIHYQAAECALVGKNVGDRELVSCYQEIMRYTRRFATGEVGVLNIDNLLPQLNGGGYNERLGASGDRMGIADRLPFLEAGEG